MKPLQDMRIPGGKALVMLMPQVEKPSALTD